MFRLYATRASRTLDTYPCLLVFHLLHMQYFLTRQWCIPGRRLTGASLFESREYCWCNFVLVKSAFTGFADHAFPHGRRFSRVESTDSLKTQRIQKLATLRNYMLDVEKWSKTDAHGKLTRICSLCFTYLHGQQSQLSVLWATRAVCGSGRDTTPMFHAQNPEVKMSSSRKLKQLSKVDSSNAYLPFSNRTQAESLAIPPHLGEIQSIYRPSEVGAHGNTMLWWDKLPRHDSVGKVPLSWLNSAWLP